MGERPGCNKGSSTPTSWSKAPPCDLDLKQQQQHLIMEAIKPLILSNTLGPEDLGRVRSRSLLKESSTMVEAARKMVCGVVSGMLTEAPRRGFGG